MADQIGDVKTEVLPFRAHRFVVRFEDDGSTVGAFTSISGIKMENQPISFRSGNDPRFVKTLLPGLTEYQRVTLSKGVIGDDKFFDWIFNSVFPGFVEGPKEKSIRRNMTITAMNDLGKNGVTWRLLDAIPVSYELGGMDASRSAVLVESLEFALIGVERVVENQNTVQNAAQNTTML